MDLSLEGDCDCDPAVSNDFVVALEEFEPFDEALWLPLDEAFCDPCHEVPSEPALDPADECLELALDSLRAEDCDPSRFPFPFPLPCPLSDDCDALLPLSRLDPPPLLPFSGMFSVV